MKMTLQINSNVDANLARQDNINYSSFNSKEGENPILSNFLNNASLNGNSYAANYHNIASYNTHNNTLTNHHSNDLLDASIVSSNNHNNASSTTTKDAVVYHHYKLGSHTFHHPSTEPTSFDLAINCIFFKRQDITLTEQRLLLAHNLDAILSNVKHVVLKSLSILHPTVKRIRIEFYQGLLDDVYALNATHMDGSIFTILYDEISAFLRDIQCVFC